VNAGDLRRRYLDYLAVLNERRFDDLVEHVADDLTYNGSPMTRTDYRDLLERDVAAVPDLTYVPGLLVVEGDRVACRLDFDCTPVGTFLGIEAAGRRLRFAEHVFYRYDGPRFVEVRSLIDRDAVRRQGG
jgi:predicted ester cyclase